MQFPKFKMVAYMSVVSNSIVWKVSMLSFLYIEGSFTLGDYSYWNVGGLFELSGFQAQINSNHLLSL